MKNIPHQFNNLNKFFEALQTVLQLIEEETPLRDENLGEQLLRNGVINPGREGLTIEEYLFGHQYNHSAKSERKLLLNKKELKKLFKDSDNKGLTIVPLRLFTNEKGMAKLDIALCRGKKNYDKREALKEQDTKRDIARIKKNF